MHEVHPISRAESRRVVARHRRAPPREMSVACMVTERMLERERDGDAAAARADVDDAAQRAGRRGMPATASTSSSVSGRGISTAGRDHETRGPRTPARRGCRRPARAPRGVAIRSVVRRRSDGVAVSLAIGAQPRRAVPAQRVSCEQLRVELRRRRGDPGPLERGAGRDRQLVEGHALSARDGSGSTGGWGPTSVASFSCCAV